MLLSIHPDNPSPRNIATVVECLRDGGLVIFPTDSVYGLGCDLMKPRAIERVARMKGAKQGLKPEKANLSLICYDLSHLADFTLPFENATFKLMKRTLPGPYTYILRASGKVPKIFKAKKKTIGIRVPDNNIPRELVRVLGNPIVTTSIRDEDDVIEYTTDPELIYEKYRDQVDIVIDGGFGHNEGTTVIDCTSGFPEVIREGRGPIDELI